MNYILLNTVLVTLPCICDTPMELFSELSRRYECYKSMNDLPTSTFEQIHLKIIIILRYWCKNSSSHQDFAGSLIDALLDFAVHIINDNLFASTTQAAQKLRKTLSRIRDDLQNIDEAQATFKTRVQQMYVVDAGRDRNETDYISIISDHEYRFSEHLISAHGSNDAYDVIEAQNKDTSPRESLASISLRESSM